MKKRKGSGIMNSFKNLFKYNFDILYGELYLVIGKKFRLLIVSYLV